MQTDALPEPEEQSTDGTRPDLEGPWRVAAIVLLVVLLLVIAISVGRVRTTVSLRSKDRSVGRDDAHAVAESAAEPVPPDLHAILQLADQRQALVRLAQLALTRCLNANGVRFQRSWTQREALHRLPDTQPYRSDLQALVLDSERVNFGHRTISDGEFSAHVNRVRPLLRESTR